MKHKVTVDRRIYVALTAYWGNDDAESTIKISRRRWKTILDGAEYKATAWSWYEGRRYPVAWHFANGTVSIDGEDGMQCVGNEPASSLIARITGDTK